MYQGGKGQEKCVLINSGEIQEDGKKRVGKALTYISFKRAKNDCDSC